MTPRLILESGAPDGRTHQRRRRMAQEPEVKRLRDSRLTPAERVHDLNRSSARFAQRSETLFNATNATAIPLLFGAKGASCGCLRIRYRT